MLKNKILIIVALLLAIASPSFAGGVNKVLENRLSEIERDVDKVWDILNEHNDYISDISLRLHYAEAHITVLEEKVKKYENK